MPIRFLPQPGTYNPARDTVRIAGKEGISHVLCVIHRDALEEIAGWESLSERELLETFEANRADFEEIANEKIADGDLEDGMVVIRVSDL